MNPWACIVGTREAGRNASLLAAARALSAAGLRVGGFVQERVGERQGHDLVAIAGGERMPLARPMAPVVDPDLCDLRFDQAAFARARQWVTGAELDAVLLEIGILEAAEQGHWPGLMDALLGPRRLLVVGVRPRSLTSIALRLPDPVAGLELPASDADIRGFTEDLVSFAVGQR